jgi:hypothetical protein
MHASSMENMRICYRRFIEGGPIESMREVLVLDVGGADINGSYREIFNEPQFTYIGADVALTEGVSLVLKDPHRLPLDNASIDIVLSGQTLEHCEFFWLAFAEMVRVVKPDGYLFLIAPSAGPIHRYPVDCYRFYPDAFAALAKYANCQLIDVWCDERGPWNDLVGVFRRHAAPRPMASRLRQTAPAYDAAISPPGTPEEEAICGDTPYLEVLAEIHRELAPSLYLEIGVRHGGSLALAQCRAVGVDPKPEIRFDLPPTASLALMASDDFFAGPYKQWLAGAPDLCFIDGTHLFENALRDFMHAERLASPGTLIIFDDVFPNHRGQAARTRRTHAWTGDVWKLYPCMREYRPDLFIVPIDASPAGLLLVSGLDPQNRILWDHYNPIVRKNIAADVDVPMEILQRAGALPGKTPVLARISAVLKEVRGSGQSPSSVVEMLREGLGAF